LCADRAERFNSVRPTLGDVIMLDHWNTWAHKDARVEKSDLQLEQRVERILDLTGT
jgi:hypothetical protein